ncbi:MAG TPA: Crp/Fnr family transcriptional regulator, partial [Allosphingosinicella sp.]|nr:Crp/Fnr family transcriptional regulator [Allosphingosinicella sp.]
MATDHLLERMVRKLELRAPLGPDDRAALLALPYTLRTLEPASYIVREGDPPVQCAALVSGYAFRQKLTGEGARQIVALHVAGDLLDLQNLYLAVSDHNVQTLTRSEVAFISRADLQRLARAHPAVEHAFFVDTLAEASIFREWVVNVGRRDSRTRIAHLLCEFAVRLEAVGLAEDNRYDLPMTQEQLADAVGLTPVHVNRTLKALDADGLILRNKRSMAIQDWGRMREAADFSARYLHLEQRGGGG